MSNKVLPDKEIDEELEEDDDGNPLIQLLYDFFIEPKSTRPGYIWSMIMAWLVAIHILAVGLQSCDGPNQYEGRENRATYSFLLTARSYWLLKLGCLIPLVIDTVGRIFLLVFVFCFRENRHLKSKLLNDSFGMGLLVVDIGSMVPFFIDVGYLRPNDVSLGDGPRLILQLIDLLLTGRILRVVKDVPAIWAIRIALTRSFEHLVIPFFVFMVFNITAAVIFYFAEPCYISSSCPWHDLFESAFFSVVTMTTTGYGNQTPMYALGRFIAITVMLFGAVFLSMPLAIIGNEYSDAWSEVTGKLSVERRMRLKLQEKKVNLLFRRSFQLMPHNRFSRMMATAPQPVEDNNASSTAESESDKKVVKANERLNPSNKKKLEMQSTAALTIADKAEEEKRRLIESAGIVKTHRRLRAVLDRMQSEENVATRLSPGLLMHLCELRSLMTSLTMSVVPAIDDLTKDLEQQKQNKAMIGRRLSALGSVSESLAAFFQSGPGTNGQSNKTAPAPAPTPAPAPARAPSAAIQPAPGGAAPSLGLLSAAVRASSLHLRSVDDDEDADVPKKSIFEWLYLKIFGNSNSSETEFSVMMKKIAKDPHSLRNRLWMVLELHHSSREARALQVLFLVLIVFSVLLLFTETLPSWNTYGESHYLCGKVVEKYCNDKHNPLLDPACFVETSTGPVKLHFDCDGPLCFKSYGNFGSEYTNFTCSSDSPPFMSQDDLIKKYGPPVLFTSRPKMNRLTAVCNRMECTPTAINFEKGNYIWVRCEFFIAVVFTLEFLVRIAVADSVVRYLNDPMNVFDCLAILPFYIDLASAGSFSMLNFGILSSSPEHYIFVIARSFKVFRLFKLIRHFQAFKVLSDTVKKSFIQLAGVLSLLVFLVVVFAIMLYEVEMGTACYVGDANCIPPDSIAGQVSGGERILINKTGGLSQFSDVFFGLWFSFVTLTSTGYGDMVPVTNTGQVMTVFLMLAGSCYLSMPLAVAASTFYECHQAFVKKRNISQSANALAQAHDIALRSRKDVAWKRRLVQIKGALESTLTRLDVFLDDLHRPPPDSSAQQQMAASLPSPNSPSPLLSRLKSMLGPMRTQMSAIAGDLEELVIATLSAAEEAGEQTGAAIQNSIGRAGSSPLLF